MVSVSTMLKAFVASLLASAVVARPLLSAVEDVTFVNNCGKDVKILKYAMLPGSKFKCDIYDPEDTITISPGTFTVAGWSSVQSYMDNSVDAFDSLGSPIKSISYADIPAKYTSCSDDPPFVEFIPVSGNVYLCSYDIVPASPSPASPSPASLSPAPAPSADLSIIIENNCINPVAVGNFFKTDDQDEDYDIRCAPYTTLANGESMYLTIPDSPENGYLSAYDTVQQTNAVVSSPNAGLSETGNYLGLMVDPNKGHPGCDNQLMGNDLWYSYSINGDYVIITC
jgi:hypothetical protein